MSMHKPTVESRISGAALSALNLELPTLLAQAPDVDAEQRRDREVPRFLASYRYSVSPWPVFVDSETVRREIEPLIQALPRLMYRALFTRFRRDPEGLERYFGWPPHLLDVLLAMRIDPREVMARYDVFMSAEGTQLLEVNCGSSIGGWELGWMAPSLSLALAERGVGSSREVRYRNIFENMLRHIFDMLIRRDASPVQGNVLLHLRRLYDGDVHDDFVAHLHEMDRRIRPARLAGSRLMICEHHDQIVFERGGVYFEGERADAILMSFPPLENMEKFYAGVTAATMTGKVISVDSDFHRILGDKRVLALLHECVRDELLSPGDASLVRRYIPWSRRVVDQPDSWNGESARLPELLQRFRPCFVLKQAKSYAGKNVIVGKLESDARWTDAIHAALAEGDWIVQAYTLPGRQLAYAPGHGFVEHDLVWGLFGFGRDYGGAFVRASQSEKCTGVINSTSGALEFVVMEDAPPANVAATQSSSIDAPPATIEDDLSPLNGRLLEAIGSDADLRSQRIDLDCERMPLFLRGWQVKVNAWPVIVDGKFAEHRFSNALNDVPRILYQAMQMYFGSDSGAFHEYFDRPPSVYELLRRRPVDVRDLNARYDLSVDAKSARILEINVGSAAGGFQTDWFQPFCDEAMRHHGATAHWGLRRRDICRPMFESLVDSMLRCITRRVCGHLLFYSFVSDPAAQRSLRESLQQVYDAVKPPELAEGRIHLFTDFSDISLDAVGEVRFDGITMDAVLFTFPDHVEVPSGLYRRLSDASLRGRVVFPDALAFAVLGNKMQLALVHECLERGLLDARDEAIVRETLPWSAMLRERKVKWCGEHTSLTALLTRERDRFVLKKAVSFGGRDVIVGRYCTDAQWVSLLAKHMGDRNWLAQEYCAPGLIRMYDPAAGICPHEAVWGLFSFGGRYGGTFLRAKPTRHTDGVINADNGAVEVLMYEQTC